MQDPLTYHHAEQDSFSMKASLCHFVTKSTSSSGLLQRQEAHSLLSDSDGRTLGFWAGALPA